MENTALQPVPDMHLIWMELIVLQNALHQILIVMTKLA
jgi:hypothetical protein